MDSDWLVLSEDNEGELKVHPNLDFKEYLPSVKGKTQTSFWESTWHFIFNYKADEKHHNQLMNHKKVALMISSAALL